MAAEKICEYAPDDKAGAIIVGSHVTQQLKQDGIQGIEIDVTKISTQWSRLLKDIVSDAEDCHSKNITPVIYTSRTEFQFEDQESHLPFGEQISAFLMDAVRNLPETTGFLISKSGIASNDVLSDGLALRTSRVVGQILAGCSVVRCPENHPRFPDIPVVILPGNAGDVQALVTVYQRMKPMN